jgi:predicted glycosyltransferase
MKAADLIVSMAGYNTIVEILSMNKPAIVIPRIKPVSEQLIRAVHLDKLGVLKCIHPAELSAKSLIDEVNNQLGKCRRTKKAIDIIDFNGLRTVTRAIGSLLDNNKQAVCSTKHRAKKSFNLTSMNEISSATDLSICLS